MRKLSIFCVYSDNPYCAAVGFSDGVTSANTVGYQQVTIPAQEYTMIGVSFVDCNGQDLKVQDIFPDPLGQGLTGASSSGTADQLMYWDPSEANSYVTLYLNSNTGTSTLQKSRHNRWCTTATQADTSWGSNARATEKRMPSGIGFFLKRINHDQPITLTMSGAVVVESQGRNIVCRNGYTMISGGFSAPFVPNPDVAGTGAAIDWLSKGCIGASSSGTADQLMFWDPTEANSYVTLYLNSNTGTSTLQQSRHNHWCTTATQADTSWGSNARATPKVIPAGRAVWYLRQGETFTLNLDQPYTLNN